MDAPILILGVPRSGTSLTAQLVRAWGACAGAEERLHQADAWNRQGYYEYLPAIELINRMLKTRLVPGPDLDLAAFAPYARAAVRSIAGRCRDRPWFWKAPRMSPLLGFWEARIAEETGRLPLCVVVVRNPLASVRSQKRYFEQKTIKAEAPDFPLAQALTVWQYYMAFLLNHTAPERTIYVAMEDLLADRGAVARFKTLLDRFYGRSGDDAMLDVPEPGLVNLRDSDLDPLTPRQRDLYAVLVAQARADTAQSVPEAGHLMPTPAEMADVAAIEQWYGTKISAIRRVAGNAAG